MAERTAGGQFAKGNISGAGYLGFAVGNRAWLRSSENRAGKYARLIEEGTNIFVGRRLFGLFGSGTRGEVGGNLTAVGEARGQQFFPIHWTPHQVLESRGTALAYLRETGQPRRISMIIKRPIEPMEAYVAAAAAFNPAEREREAIAQAFRNSGVGTADRRGRTTPTEAQSARFADATLRGKFISARALSTGSLSLARLDKVFLSELTAANRLLAEGLAAEVAAQIQKRIKRKATSSRKLEEATLDARNRFPT